MPGNVNANINALLKATRLARREGRKNKTRKTGKLSNVEKQELEEKRIANLLSLEEHNVKLAIEQSKANAREAEKRAIKLQAALLNSFKPKNGGRRKTHRRRASHKRRKTHRRS
jgi:hypothetical protein